MKLNEILDASALRQVDPKLQQIEILDVTADSRQVKPGSLFVAMAGAKAHGDQFIQDAVQRGAKVIVAERRYEAAGVIAIPVSDPKQTLVNILQKFYRLPSERVRLVGVTGTNGKTTITYLLESVFSSAGKKSGVIGTVNHRYGGKILDSKNTTPGLADNYKLIAEMAAAGVNYCTMEVSSHALVQGRVAGLNFQEAVFTNLTSDHLDYHKNREEYFQAKTLLFVQLPPPSVAVINRDDEFGQRLQKMCKANILTYGLHPSCAITAHDVQLSLEGTAFKLVTPIGEEIIKTRLIGLHNVYNILSVAGVAISEKIPLAQVKEGIEKLAVVPGRLERVDAGQNFHVFVDYAHTEDALLNVLTSLRKVSPTRIILVFGCGGDRDKTKRPKMGKLACHLADFSIVTNDNPRSEEPEDIARQIVAGFEKNNFTVQLNRDAAILQALKMAKKGEVVLIAGKGHETYQIFKDRTIDFDERKIVREHLMEVLQPSAGKSG